jgi:hypothetical protein
MFHKLGAGACQVEARTVRATYVLQGVTACANRCKSDNGCVGFELKVFSNSNRCTTLFGSRPTQICSGDCGGSASRGWEYQCWVRSAQSLYYIVHEKCTDQGERETGYQEMGSLSLSSCLNRCSEQDGCNWAMTDDGKCLIGSSCPSDDDFDSGSSGNPESSTTLLAHRVEFYSSHEWLATHSCDLSSVGVYCQGEMDYLKTCFQACDNNNDCRAVSIAYDVEEKTVSFSCPYTRHVVFAKRDELQLLVGDNYERDDNERDDWTFEVNVLYRVLCAALFILIAYCFFRRMARRRLEIIALSQRPEATEIVSIAASETHPIWGYLKEVSTPENRKEECCSICLDPFQNRVTQAPCGHVFHRDCIREWLLNTKKECPICRAKVYAAPPPKP